MDFALPSDEDPMICRMDEGLKTFSQIVKLKNAPITLVLNKFDLFAYEIST